MASPGGGKIKSKGEHSPVKPYDQRKSFFQRVTDGIKDVLRPSWMAADPADVKLCSTQSSPKSTGTAALQGKGQIPNNEHSPTQVGSPKSMSVGTPASLLPSSSSPSFSPSSSRKQSSKSPGCNTSSQSGSPAGNTVITTTTTNNNSNRLWSVSLSARDPPSPSLGLHDHHHPLQPYNPSSFSSSPFARPGSGSQSGSSARVLTGSGRETSSSRSGFSPLWSSGKNGAMVYQPTHSGASQTQSQRGAVSGGGRTLLQRSERRVGSSPSPSLDFSSHFNRSSGPHSFASYGPHVSPMPSSRNVITVSTPMGRPYHLKHRYTLSSHSFSERLSSPADAAASVSPLKRQKMTPEMSRKGRSLQPALRGQPAFSMAAFCSPTLNSPPVRQTVTPKPLAPSNSAVLSSSTARIFKTIEKLSDAKRAKVNLEDSDSILSYTPPSSYRNNSRSLQLQRTFQPESVETLSPAASPAVVPQGSEQEEEASPVADSESPGSSASPSLSPKAEDQMAVSSGDSDKSDDKDPDICMDDNNHDDHNESSDDDIQIIEPPEQLSPRKDSGSNNSHNTSAFGRSPQQPDTYKEKSLMFSMTTKAIPQSASSTGSTPAGGLGTALNASPPSLFTSPSSWGSTAAKPKSILAGNSKPDSGNRKSVSFQQKDLPGKNEPWGSKPVAPFLTGSVMDILAKPSAPKPSTPLSVDNKALSSAKSDSENSLSAKFAPPPGSWECDVCMIRNTANCLQCMACQTPKSGASNKGSLGTATSVASINCGSAAATGGFKFGTSPSLSSPAFPAPTSVSQPISSSAGFVFGQTNPTTTTTSSSSNATSASGFQFGKPSSVTSTSSSLPASSGFQLQSSSPAMPAISSATSSSTGFVFGKPTLVSSSSAVTTTAGSLLKSPLTTSLNPATVATAAAAAFPQPPTLGTVCAGAASTSGSTGFTFGKPSSVGSGFKFGVKSDASSTSKDTSASVQFGVSESVSPCQSVKSDAAGFQFGSSSSIATSVLGTSTAFSSSSSASSFNSSAAVNLSNHNSLAQCEQTKGNNKSKASLAISVSDTDRKETNTFNSASSDKNCDRVSVSATESFSSSAGSFQFSSPSYTSSSTAGAKVSSQDRGSAKQNIDLKASSVSGFSFEKTVPKTSENGFSFGTMDTKAPSSDAGFSFGKTDPKPSSDSGFSFGKTNSKLSSDKAFSFGKTDPKPSTDNGFSFGKDNSETSSDNGFSFGKSSPSNGGFSFGNSANKSQDQFTTSAVAPSNQKGPNLFTTSTGSKGFTFGVTASPGPLNKAPGPLSSPPEPDTEKKTTGSILNGEAESMKSEMDGESFMKGPSSGASAGFSFASPSLLKKVAGQQENAFADLVQSSLLTSTCVAEGEPDSTSPDVVLIDDEGEEVETNEAEPSSMGNQAPSSDVFGNTQSHSSGFVFGALSGKETKQPSGTAGRGSFQSGQSAVGTSSLINPAAAAAAFPLVSEASGPIKGFNFSGATQSSFSFGSASSSTNSSAFQFASPKSVEPSPVQIQGGTFSFGKATPSAQGSNPAPAPAFSSLTPATGVANGPATASFTVGTGESPRKLKRAVRRVPKT